MRTRCLVLSFVLAGALLAPLVQGGEGSSPAATSTGTLTGGTLEMALETISTEEIRADIFFIASDELEGRDTVSDGQRVAARYLRSRLERLGVTPGARDGYFYEYPLRTQRLETKDTRATWTSGESKAEFEFGRDYFLIARHVRSASAEGGVVFVGAGRPGDFKKTPVAGKWALVLDDGGLVGDLEKLLAEHGALGALMTPAPGAKVEPYERRYASDVKSLSRASLQFPSSRNRSSKGDRSSDGEGTGDSAPVESGSSSRRADGPAPMLVWLTPNAAGTILGAKLPREGTELAGTFSHTRKLAGNDGVVMAENVCGFWAGSDPKLSKEVIVVSAHYDHVGYGGGKEIHNGADDNGSGTCGLLALAEALTVHGPLRRSVLLMWVSGEEKGLWGSQAWTENPWLPEGHRAICDINIDMIGRNAPDYLLITPTAAHAEYNGLVRLAEQVAPLEGFPKLGSCDAYWSRSDHANFARNLKIPVAFLFSDIHEDYHKPGDDPEKIDCDKIRRVSRTVLRMIAGLQDDVLDLAAK